MRPNASSSPSAIAPLWPLQLELLVFVCLACLVGLLSRPVGFLAAFWPANAIMLGLLLRHPPLGKSVSTWVLALVVYIAMDWLSGSDLFLVLTLNMANVLGVLSAWIYLSRQSQAVLRFQRQRSVLILFIGSVIGSVVCSVLGASASSMAFGVPWEHSIALWLSGEFCNYILFLPILMAAPQGWIWQWPKLTQWELPNPWPVLALFASELLSQIVGGPSSIAFLMPAMVWSAMSYSVLTVSLLNMLVCFGKTAALTMGPFSFTPEHAMDVVSFRASLAMLTLAPLAVASAYVLSTQALQRLNHAVNYDFLTGALARRALMERGYKLLTRLIEEGQPIAVLMVDMDHFKRINDIYGHAQGDIVLQEFAALASKALRPDDLLGRLGGEEFGVILPRANHEQAVGVAQRLCELVRNHEFLASSQGAVQITVSIGLHAVDTITPKDCLEALLCRADQALYRAKNNGRDQVQFYEEASKA